MTLGIVLFAKDNTIVIVSDKRVTGGTAAMPARGDFVEKIYKVTDRCGLTTAGDAGSAAVVIELFLKKIRPKLPKRGRKRKTKELSVVDAAEIFRKTAVGYYTRWFKDMSMREWVANVRDGVIPHFRILLVGFDTDEKGKPSERKIIELSSLKRFAPVNITTGFGTIGVTTIAQYLLYRFYTDDQQEEAAAAGLAGFCIQETSSQEGSVGDQFQVASFSTNKPFQFYSDDELERIKRRCAEIKTEFQIALLSPPKVKEQ